MATEAMLANGANPHNQQSSKLPQYLYSIAVTMSAFSAGTMMAWTGPALPWITENNSTNFTDPSVPLVITKAQATWVASLLPLGGLLGALPAGHLSNMFGRKITTLSLSVPFVISWLMIIFASSAWHLYIARLIGGLATGASSALSPMYIGEIAETSIRGSLGSYFQLLLTVGILYTYVLGAFLSYTSLSVLCGIIPILFFFMFISAPETPVYLLSKGNRNEADASLRRLRGRSYNVTFELDELQKETERSASNKVSFSVIFTRKAALRGLIIALGLMLIQQLSGVNAVIFFANDIFKSAGSTLSPEVSAIIIGVVQVIVTLVSSLLVDKAGRKILLLISAAVMAICQGLLGLFFYLKDNNHDVSSLTLIPLASVSLYIIIFSLGFGPIPWMMTGELFAPDVKGPSTGMVVGLNWLLAFTVTKTFGPLAAMLGNGGTFGIFAVVCALGLAFVIILVPETKGKSLDEVQKILAGNKETRRHSYLS